MYGFTFNIFRAAIICQGIAARIALGQGKNKQAKVYATMRNALADLARELTQEAMKVDLQYAREASNAGLDFEGIRARL